jgi:hypothetical protein
MQDDIIRTKRDSQEFGIGAWCAFLFWYGFIILYGIAYMSVVSPSIWQEILSGDYGQTNLVNAFAISVVVLFLLAFYSVFISG